LANAYTATQLLLSLKARGLIPTTDETFSATDFLRFVNEEVQTYIVPLLLSVREDYLVTYSDLSVTSGTDAYDIPERAVASKLRGVFYLSGSTYQPLPRIELEAAHLESVTGTPSAYYLRANKIVLVPSPSGSSTLRLHYYQRPNRVVETSAVGEITAINTGTRVVTLSASCPSTFATSVTFDLVKGKAGFDTLGKDLAVSAVGASSVTFTATLPTDLAVGDFVCLAQETPIPQIPVELHPLLSERVTTTVLKALGDSKATYAVAEQMERKLIEVLSPRVEGSPRYVVNRYGAGWGR
jgi:hypothetical protein